MSDRKVAITFESMQLLFTDPKDEDLECHEKVIQMRNEKHEKSSSSSSSPLCRTQTLGKLCGKRLVGVAIFTHAILLLMDLPACDDDHFIDRKE
jgi:hypothetical protein